MRLFDDQGMMIFPSPLCPEFRERKHVLVVSACYCPNRHNLVNSRAQFNEFDGILLRLRKGEEDGLVALSPVYGDRSRISLGLRLERSDVYTLLCPECGITLPVYDQCDCGADLFALFMTGDVSFANCICVCSRVGCHHSVVRHGNEVLTEAAIQHLARRT